MKKPVVVVVTNLAGCEMDFGKVPAQISGFFSCAEGLELLSRYPLDIEKIFMLAGYLHRVYYPQG